MTLSRTPLRRGAAPKRTAGIKKRNPKRRQSEFARAYHSKERVLWVKSLRCAAWRFGLCSGPTENAHTVTGGMGRKAGYDRIAPLCRAHHCQYDLHTGPFAADSTRHAVKLQAILTEEAWLAHTQRIEK